MNSAKWLRNWRRCVDTMMLDIQYGTFSHAFAPIYTDGGEDFITMSSPPFADDIRCRFALLCKQLLDECGDGLTIGTSSKFLAGHTHHLAHVLGR